MAIAVSDSEIFTMIRKGATKNSTIQRYGMSTTSQRAGSDFGVETGSAIFASSARQDKAGICRPG
ncbi:hypothetical protein D3C87_2095540 [compost metagenome]